MIPTDKKVKILKEHKSYNKYPMIRKFLFIIPFLLVFFACENEEIQEEQDHHVKENKEKRDDVVFTAKSEKVAETGEMFQVTFEINANTSSFNPPDFKGFDVSSGPVTSSFSSTSIINGNKKVEVKTSYTYTVSASAPGDYTIDEATVSIDGFEYKSNKLNIKIIGEKQNKPGNQNNTGKETDDYFMTADFSKENIYNGEHILITYKLWFKNDFSNIYEVNFPDFTGFKSEVLEAPRNLTSQNEMYNGQMYRSALLKKVLIIAQKPGKYAVKPYSLELKIRKKDGKTKDFFGNTVDNYKIINKKVQTKEKDITVLELPKPAPENFSGISGHDFHISSEINKNEINSEDGANLKVKITGFGNIYLLNDFNLILPEGLRSFKPEVEKSEKYTDNGLYGERTFTYVIVGNKEGHYSIPAPEFTFFNTKTGIYDKIESKTVELTVGKGSGITENESNLPMADSKDIRFIKTNDYKLKSSGKGFSGNFMFYLLYLILFSGFMIFIFVKRKQEKERADTDTFKRKRAGLVSAKRLKKAFVLMQKNDNDTFYQEILNAVWGYLGDKLSVSAVGLTADSVSEILSEKGIEEEQIKRLRSLIETCGYAKYGNTGGDNDPKNVYDDAAELINIFEKNL